MTSELHLSALLLELAESLERNGSRAERERWPPYLRGLAENLDGGQPVDFADFHRQLAAGTGSIADTDVDGVWQLVEQIVTVLPRT